MTATVLLVRHGETTWNRAGRIQGWADSTLTDRGRDQARAVGSHLLDDYAVDRLVVSDLKRTRETAEVLRETGLDVGPSPSRAWRERHFGELQGATRTDAASRHATFHREGSLLAVQSVPGGESLPAFETRVREGWRALVDAVDAGETAVVVTHGGPIRAVLAEITGRDLSSFAADFSPSNCGVTAIECRTEPSLVARDRTEHLPG
ncbi:histidine phosphatase family protein [Halosimplex salinum]|uniref:histidine phosphatase family protein n=1 Tax=Halosimplex salinum TaxID=1710538 RepID=UPI0013DE79C4|nr:histidine phosphatase family protein [Halosimplex salinum]